jgi:hypothetical protein
VSLGTLILLRPFMFPLCARNLNTPVVAHTSIELSVCRRILQGRHCVVWGGWTLIRLETLAERRGHACVMFIFDILSSRLNSSNLLSLIGINAPW